MPDQLDYAEFFKQVIADPAVLLLGQDCLRQYGGEDYFLSACQTRFELESADSYDALVDACIDAGDVMGIWHNISTRVAVSDGLETLASLPWNCVLTSSFHDVLDRALAADWRTVTPVLTDQVFPADPRSRTKLNLYKLFGCVTRDVDSEQPPVDFMQRMQRGGVAKGMLRQLPSLVTPKGWLIIDSLAVDDWLDTTTLAEAVSQLGSSQAHLFGVTEKIRSVREIGYLTQMKKLTLHTQPLAAALREMKGTTLVDLVEASRVWTEGVTFSFPSGKKHVFKPTEWRRLTSGLTVLTDAEARNRYEFSSEDERYLSLIHI